MPEGRALCWILLAGIAAAMVYRLAPLLGDPHGLTRFFITEDGYLLLTVARNMALGLGLTVSAGEIATNGIQPLATFVHALPFLVGGGDKLTGLWGVIAISVAVSGLGAVAVHRFARQALGPGIEPLTVTALWLAGPLLVFHMMNGLETGLYTLVLLSTLLYSGHLMARRAVFSWPERLLLGGLLGLVFLARNDGAFLVAAVLAVRFVQIQGRQSLGTALAEGVPAGLVSLAVASPWLAYNLTLTGSVIPISGQAQSLRAGFADNLALSPVKAFETMFPMLPLPGSVETLPMVGLVTGGVTALVLGVFLWRTLRTEGTFRWVILAYAIYAVMIFCYYSLAFGAPHFLSRYFAPSAPLLIVAGVSMLGALLRSFLGPAGQRVAALAGVAALVLCLGLLARQLVPGVREHGHFQVVEWVEDHLDDSDWVAAVQTGTLGYWHDRTINLDGKVNPHALAARKSEGNIYRYVVNSDITAIVDWVGVASWAQADTAGFNRTFELVLADPDRNLAVLQRRND